MESELSRTVQYLPIAHYSSWNSGVQVHRTVELDAGAQDNETLAIERAEQDFHYRIGEDGRGPASRDEDNYSLDYIEIRRIVEVERHYDD